MSRRSVLSAACLVLLFAAARPAGAYRVVTPEGREIEATRLARVGESFRLATEEGVVELPPGGVDFYATFRANLADSEVLVFAQGGFLRFEGLTFSRGRVVIQLGEGRVVSVPEALVDFRGSVLEGAFVELPADHNTRASVAKATESPPPPRPDRSRSRRARTRAAQEARSAERGSGSQTRGSR